MPAKRPADPIVEAERPAVESAFDASRTAVLEPPAERQVEFPSEADSVESDSSLQIANYRADEEAESENRSENEPTTNSPNEAESREFDPFARLLGAGSPLRDEAAMNATLDEAESAIADAEEAPNELIAQAFSQNSPLALGKGQEARPIPLFKGDKTVKPDPKPGTGKDPGAFLSMARNILAQLPGEESAALFFTSPTDGEGKTETILPLAEALIEESGRRTILVDANLHCPDLTREWQFSSRRGIFDVLVGEADWWEAVQETGLPKLSIMLNNGLPRKNAIVSQPLAFSELLEKLKGEYRLVLIDAASLSHAESIPMLRHCKGVFLVVRLGHASRRVVRDAGRVIAKAGGKLLGCIAVGDVLEPA
jgi:Mrp family chromosome partitioning ATPase